MEILVRIKNFLQFMGHSVDRVNLFISITLIFALIFCVYGTFNYAAVHIDDITDCVNSIITGSGGIVAIASYCSFLKNHKIIWKIFDKIENVVRKGKSYDFFFKRKKHRIMRTNFQSNWHKFLWMSFEKLMRRVIFILNCCSTVSLCQRIVMLQLPC